MADGDEPPQRVEIEAGGDTSAATFTLHNEDHTIGNSLRYVLNKDPQVSFVGYSVPHPSEPKMNLRIQTVGPSATTVLHGALGTLYEITAHTKETFERALEDFKAKQER
ncbi:hypothetical protein EMIHUDRAFT_194396 [Emiliania huxleyi CCMP1516]|uniref:DNA-directed RNA polymerase RBP11-like dimerisation domain-containing protein n=2 Tax=Emiliania huxleyi TaxID=2903 RepID=A0A0D3L1F7_EMIH1|nr:hypothetical protein EMIHUDRAFT_194396 [Emiliania huxleyi CCMP1516]EOD41842.1 hypothetical protein EMIHUDRAFT_194396 [Emiliania huxleyi CCMP1516]|mmetsp:Transcript_22792/g.67155  ORF Transcript_22792/g.67155 Transcript_22792/m.67155 type:complete len:109 (+) Transcript_22792:119-445(+)|eukprot:XP_005794271.1 hypothetical protein EMIHUDRAFT_194396 [Emiliania huxleyi CCMP1516]